MNSNEMQARIDELPEIIEGLNNERTATERAGDVKKLVDVKARIDIALAELRRLTVEIHPVKKSELQAEADRLQAVAEIAQQKHNEIKAQVAEELRPRFGHSWKLCHVDYNMIVDTEISVFEADSAARAAGLAATNAAYKVVSYGQ